MECRISDEYIPSTPFFAFGFTKYILAMPSERQKKFWCILDSMPALICQHGQGKFKLDFD
jgi:hypothetical protein